MQLILKWAIFVWISKLTQKLPTKRCFLAFFKVGIFCVNFQIDTNLPTQMSFLAFFKVGIFCVFFQIYTKIAHLHSQLNLSSSPRWAVFVSFSSSHPVIWKNTQKLPTIWDACITTNMWANFVFFSNSPPVIWKNTQNLPTSGRSINTVFPWWAIFVWFSSPYSK